MFQISRRADKDTPPQSLYPPGPAASPALALYWMGLQSWPSPLFFYPQAPPCPSLSVTKSLFGGSMMNSSPPLLMLL